MAGSTTTRFAYDGINMLADYDGTNALQHRYVFGPGTDEPIVEYSSTGVRTFLSADERGSIIARTDSTGALSAANQYDEYGIPQTDATGHSQNTGLFQYTGQAWISQLGMYYYKARIYSPTLGRFMQTDPIGTADNANLYAYVHNDSINLIDPSGLESDPPPDPGPPIDVVACRLATEVNLGGICVDLGGFFSEDQLGGGGSPIQFPGGGIGAVTGDLTPIVIVAKKTLCGALSYLPNNGELRLGADIQGYGGIGGAAGAGVFVDSTGNFGFNMYYGWGAGLGFAVGAGLSIGNDRPNAGSSRISHLQGTIGLGVGGASGTYSKSEGGSLSGGVSAGPRIGIVAGSVTGTSNSTFRGSIGC